jgi:hypothetical protein
MTKGLGMSKQVYLQRTVISLWLGTDEDLLEAYQTDPEVHARAYEGGYCVAALLTFAGHIISRL